jgi:3-keto-disaccharide hydrolase
MKKRLGILTAIVVTLATAGFVTFCSRPAPPQKESQKAAFTEPASKWPVHDMNRPQPTVITPGTFSNEQKPGQHPSDAIVLFDGKDLSKWQSRKGGPAQWKVEHGYFQVAPGTGDIETQQKFGPIQLHLEWSEPTPAHGTSQGRGNSGVFLQGQYEVQVLDSFHNITYPDGQTGAVYGQHVPLVNACRPPGEWQTYDMAYTPAIWQDGQVTTPAYVTVFQNGVLVQNHVAIYGPTSGNHLPYNPEVGSVGPLRLQDHHGLVRYRNIWVREIKPVD